MLTRAFRIGGTTTEDIAMSRLLHLASLLFGLSILATTAQAQTTKDPGKREYETSCAGCHGTAGRGDGPLFKHLVKPPSDLTMLAKRNGGVFPVQRVVETIDGRLSAEIGPHGSREMPIWGQVYRSQALEPGAGEVNPDWYAHGRMLALVDYLWRIQQK
jgi:mono/diheme cytochrome c family protein